MEKVWQSRHGWQAWAFLKAQSGMTVTVTHATNFNGADQRTTARFFTTAAFAQAPQFTLGTASQNPIRGPGYNCG
ncbi:MAG TPA: hypothetical protein VNV86_05060 [Candidatus Acidoferrum sp.]|nr:hypothetical protein [Candidatus Acidoferrum sp.]